jgi:hypothetical protein
LIVVYVGSQRSLGTQSIEDSKNDAMARKDRRSMERRCVHRILEEVSAV